jgi:hypothetical protein
VATRWTTGYSGGTARDSHPVPYSPCAGHLECAYLLCRGSLYSRPRGLVKKKAAQPPWTCPAGCSPMAHKTLIANKLMHRWEPIIRWESLWKPTILSEPMTLWDCGLKGKRERMSAPFFGERVLLFRYGSYWAVFVSFPTKVMPAVVSAPQIESPRARPLLKNSPSTVQPAPFRWTDFIEGAPRTPEKL